MTKLAPIASEDETARQRPTYLCRRSADCSGVVVRCSVLVFHHGVAQRLSPSRADRNIWVWRCARMRCVAAAVVSQGAQADAVVIDNSLRAMRVVEAQYPVPNSTELSTRALGCDVELHGASARQRVDVSMFVTGRALESMRVSPNAAEGERTRKEHLWGQRRASSPAATKGASGRATTGAGEGLSRLSSSDCANVHNTEKARG
jgi:hypothetical protein